METILNEEDLLNAWKADDVSRLKLYVEGLDKNKKKEVIVECIRNKSIKCLKFLLSDSGIIDHICTSGPLFYLLEFISKTGELGDKLPSTNQLSGFSSEDVQVMVMAFMFLTEEDIEFFHICQETKTKQRKNVDISLNPKLSHFVVAVLMFVMGMIVAKPECLKDISVEGEKKGITKIETADDKKTMYRLSDESLYYKGINGDKPNTILSYRNQVRDLGTFVLNF